MTVFVTVTAVVAVFVVAAIAIAAIAVGTVDAARVAVSCDQPRQFRHEIAARDTVTVTAQQ